MRRVSARSACSSSTSRIVSVPAPPRRRRRRGRRHWLVVHARQVDLEGRAPCPARCRPRWCRRSAARCRRPWRGRGPVPLPSCLGGEERLEDALPRGFVHAGAGVADGHHARAARAAWPGARRRSRRRRSTFRVSMVSVPPSGIASRALTARFSSTCSIWPGSAFTLPRSRGRRGPRARRLRRAAARACPACPRTTAVRSITAGLRICWRLRASSCRVSAAARSPAQPDLRPGRRAADRSSRRLSAARSAVPLMTVSRLLKSWAMPPASRPMLSIFCACRNCSSSWRCSVMSVAKPTMRSMRPAALRTGNARERIQRVLPSGWMMRKVSSNSPLKQLGARQLGDRSRSSAGTASSHDRGAAYRLSPRAAPDGLVGRADVQHLAPLAVGDPEHLADVLDHLAEALFGLLPLGVALRGPRGRTRCRWQARRGAAFPRRRTRRLSPA